MLKSKNCAQYNILIILLGYIYEWYSYHMLFYIVTVLLEYINHFRIYIFPMKISVTHYAGIIGWSLHLISSVMTSLHTLRVRDLDGPLKGMYTTLSSQ